MSKDHEGKYGDDWFECPWPVDGGECGEIVTSDGDVPLALEADKHFMEAHDSTLLQLLTEDRYDL